MIKFFRKIRQRLLTENKFSKYLVYAIGEIILVVIGILIALSISNWNEDRKDQKLETQALINLKTEFDENQRRFLNTIKRNIQTIDTTRYYYEILTNDTVPISEKINRTKTTGFFDSPLGISNAVLNSLFSTGDIDKIKNDSLKVLLTNWPTIVGGYKIEEEKYRNSVNEYRLYINEKLPRGFTSKTGVIGNYYPNNLEAKLNSYRVNFIEDIQYHNHLSEIATWLNINLIFVNFLNRDCIKISKLIEKELKDRGIDVSEN